jgi:hypothetical protein
MPTEIITDAAASQAALRNLADQVNDHIDLVAKHEGAFEEATLEPRLLIGQRILEAQQHFGLSRAEAGHLGGRPSAEETVSRRDKVSTPAPNFVGFSAWLLREIPRLKRPTALKYAAAYTSLGLPSDAPVAKIRGKIRDLYHLADKDGTTRPGITALAKAAPKPETSAPLAITSPPDSPQQRLEDAREALHLWRETWDRLVKIGTLDDLDQPGLADLKDFLLTCRDRVNKRLK